MVLIYCDLWTPKLDIIEKIINHYNTEIKENILIYSVFGKKYKNQKFKNFSKLFYTAESILSNEEADYIIGFLPTNGKCIKLINYERIQKCEKGLEYKIYYSLNLNWKLMNKTKFCCFIVSNSRCSERNDFYELLNKYKKVDSLGKFKNNCDILKNINFNSKDYYDVISEYKFIICFENVSKQYYLTEKIYNAFKSNCIPIYWGDPNVTDIFNEKTFIKIENRDSFSKKIELIKLLDNNDELYNNYFKEMPVLNPDLHDNRVDDSIDKIHKLLN